MMSPLALLNEGEMAEIITHHSTHGKAHPHGQAHHHQHGRGPCGGNCADCRCRGNDQENISVSSHDHLEDMGLRPGKHVEMITNKGTGPLVLRIDETRIAMGRGAAMKIYVRRIEA